MPRFFVAARAIALLLGLGASAWSAGAELRIQHWVEPSGARVYWVSSMAIPMVDVQVDFDGGSRRDPQGQSGLASATANLMSAGVKAWRDRPALDENALAEAWLDTGAQFGVSASAERLSFVLRSLSEPSRLSAALALAAQQLAAPQFPPTVWQRDRERQIAALREAQNRPATQAQRAFAQAVYGTHPLGRQTQEQSLQAIEVPDLMAHHQRTVLACRAVITVVGALDRAATQALVRTLTEGMGNRLGSAPCPPLPKVPEVQPLSQAQTLHLPFASTQAQVLIGQPGVPRRDPEFLALLVGNHILGAGGFTSRLTHEVREKRGLSYSVFSGFAPGLHAGAFQINLSTRSDQAQAALAVAQEVLRTFVAQGPTQAELDAAKDFLVKSFALRIDSNRKWLENVAQIAWYQLPLDYLDTWPQAVSALSTEDIRKAFARVLQPERQVTVVLGAAP